MSQNASTSPTTVAADLTKISSTSSKDVANITSTPVKDETIRVVLNNLESNLESIVSYFDMNLSEMQNDKKELAKERQALQTAKEQLAKEKNESEKAMDAKLNEQLSKEKAKLYEQLSKERQALQTAEEQLAKEKEAMNAKLKEQLAKERQALETEKTKLKEQLAKENDESEKAMNAELKQAKADLSECATHLRSKEEELLQCQNDLNVLTQMVEKMGDICRGDSRALKKRKLAVKIDCNDAEEDAKKSQREMVQLDGFNSQEWYEVREALKDSPDVLNSEECYELREALEDAEGVKDAAEDVSNASNPKVKDAAGEIFVGELLRGPLADLRSPQNFDSAKLNKCDGTCVVRDGGCGQSCSYKTVEQIQAYARDKHLILDGELMTEDAIKNTNTRRLWQLIAKNQPTVATQFALPL